MGDLNDGYISELSVRLSNAETEIERLHGVQKTLQAIADETVASNGRLRAEIARLKAVLQEISEGKGRYSMDHFQHAKNTIEDMKELARDALEGKP